MTNADDFDIEHLDHWVDMLRQNIMVMLSSFLFPLVSP